MFAVVAMIVIIIAVFVAVVPAVFIGIVDLQNAGSPVVFQLANGSLLFIAAEVVVVSDRLDLGIIDAVYLLNPVLPVVPGRSIARVDWIITVVPAENHIAAIAVTAVVGGAVVTVTQNDAAGLVAELSTCGCKGAADHQECKHSFHSVSVLPCVSKKSASISTEG